MGLALSVDSTDVHPGGLVRASVSGLEDGDTATVELVVVERLPLTITTERRTLVSTTVRSATPAELEVPLDTPRPHSSPRGSITLELHAVRERLGPDDRGSIALTLVPSERSDHRRREQRVFAPAASGTVDAHPWHHRLLGKVGVWTIAALVVLWRFDGGWRIAGVVGATVVLALAVIGEWQRGRHVPVGLGYRIETNPVRPGDDVVVHLSGNAGTRIDVGLRAVESVLTGSAASSRSRVSTLLHEVWAEGTSATSESSVSLQAPLDQPTTYRGAWVSIEYEVGLRRAGAAVHGGSSPGDIVLGIDIVP
jgi:hypothetical protein